ncbi:GNAT family N-acetyltransferase [Sediminibacillus massiliensis]|uniref:GNAT family N-acetyltransferase n=1 Tax=Sediminibacillus massiliensis TaxID=1926277 RepID=UPI0009883A5A|nr:GNAT family N-acetyltransferase [Sediminibacillus massiliensis]
MIRLANKEDLPRIMEIVKASVKVMNEQGNEQWNEDYPLESDFKGDLENQELYVAEIGGTVTGAACISEKEHSEYPLISWRKNDKALTVKRVAVDPSNRGSGIASGLYKHAEQVGREKGLHYLKTDTFSKNQSAQRLFRKNGYQFVQARRVEEKDDELWYFDKLID